MTDGRLYGRVRVVEFVRDALRRSGVPGGPLPLVLLVGSHGSGGTVLLDRLWREFGGRCLSARLDLDRAEAVEDIVLAAVRGWGRRVPGIHPVRFCRTRMIFKALSFVDDGGGRAAFEKYLAADPQDAAASSALDGLAARAAPLLPADQQVLLSAAAKVVGTLLSGTGRRRRGDAAARQWLEQHAPGSGSATDRLWEVHRRHHGRSSVPDAARSALKTVCAALLADLRADFNGRSLRGQRPANCLLLLDEAGSRAGELFLELVAECRRESHRARERPDPVLVVAARRGRAHTAMAPLASTDDRLAFAVRHPAAPAGADHPVWWYPIRLTDLGHEDVVVMCGSSVLGSQKRDASHLRNLTGGHPEAVDRLAHLLARPEAAARDPRLLLDRPLPLAEDLPDHWPPPGRPARPGAAAPDRDGGPTVAAYLLRRILADDHGDDLTDGLDDSLAALGADRLAGIGGGPAADPGGGSLLDTMAVLALTPGLRLGAGTAALHFLGWTRFSAAAARHRLAATLWLQETPPEPPEEQPGGPAAPAAAPGPAVRLHPLAAVLLHRRLAAVPEVWDGAHQGYAAHYSGRDDEPLRHHHLLARVTLSHREPLAEVAGYLEREYDRCATTEQWQSLLGQVAAAPNRLRTQGDPRTFVTGLAGRPDPRDRGRTIGRLVAARWLHGDRSFDPHHHLAGLVAAEYGNLAAIAGGNEALFEESGKYHLVEEEWKQR
ncbi:ATP-binding protein [Actinacidiphila sp. bgisy145]|uniref:ATP-binding protein n=1 Tax=Actinacidiphila sp. bgisy145 TaxID=3413792 RepID=UPI003EB9149D